MGRNYVSTIELLQKLESGDGELFFTRFVFRNNLEIRVNCGPKRVLEMVVQCENSADMRTIASHMKALQPKREKNILRYRTHLLTSPEVRNSFTRIFSVFQPQLVLSRVRRKSVLCDRSKTPESHTAGGD